MICNDVLAYLKYLTDSSSAPVPRGITALAYQFKSEQIVATHLQQQSRDVEEESSQIPLAYFGKVNNPFESGSTHVKFDIDISDSLS